MSRMRFFLEPLPPGQEIVCMLEPGDFNGLSKLVNSIPTMVNLVIQNSTFSYDFGNWKLFVDFNNLIGPGINISIDNAGNKLKNLKDVNGNEDVAIIEDKNNSRYILTNGDNLLDFPKQTNHATPVQIPNLEGITTIGHEVEILDPTSISKKIRKVKAAYIDLIIYHGHMARIYIPGWGYDTFEGLASPEYNRSKPSLVLRSNFFLMIPKGTIRLNLYNLNNQYILRTESEIGYNMQPVTFETLIAQTNYTLPI